MKKSNMVKVLTDAIKMGVYVNENNGQLVTEEKEIGYILDQLVAAGMEPPKRIATNIFDGAVDEYGMTNEWDDE